jgi:TPR repeat protein
LRAAEHGRAEAQFKAGLFYEEGQGVPQNYKSAAKWYSQAAQQRRPEAEFKLGSLYEKGLGVQQSKDEAIKWYTKANDDGYAPALDALRALEQ